MHGLPYPALGLWPTDWPRTLPESWPPYQDKPSTQWWTQPSSWNGCKKSALDQGTSWSASMSQACSWSTGSGESKTDQGPNPGGQDQHHSTTTADGTHWIVSRSTYFQFQSDFFEASDGTPMGSIGPPSLPTSSPTHLISMHAPQINLLTRSWTESQLGVRWSGLQRSTDCNGEIKSLIRPWLISLRTWLIGVPTIVLQAVILLKIYCTINNLLTLECSFSPPNPSTPVISTSVMTSSYAVLIKLYSVVLQCNSWRRAPRPKRSVIDFYATILLIRNIDEIIIT